MLCSSHGTQKTRDVASGSELCFMAPLASSNMSVLAPNAVAYPGAQKTLCGSQVPSTDFPEDAFAPQALPSCGASQSGPLVQQRRPGRKCPPDPAIRQKPRLPQTILALPPLDVKPAAAPPSPSESSACDEYLVAEDHQKAIRRHVLQQRLLHAVRGRRPMKSFSMPVEREKRDTAPRAAPQLVVPTDCPWVSPHEPSPRAASSPSAAALALGGAKHSLSRPRALQLPPLSPARAEYQQYMQSPLPHDRRAASPASPVGWVEPSSPTRLRRRHSSSTVARSADVTENLLEDSPRDVLLLLLARRTGQIVSANRLAAAGLGYTLEELQGRLVFDIADRLWADDWARACQSMGSDADPCTARLEFRLLKSERRGPLVGRTVVLQMEPFYRRLDERVLAALGLHAPLSSFCGAVGLLGDIPRPRSRQHKRPSGGAGELVLGRLMLATSAAGSPCRDAASLPSALNSPVSMASSRHSSSSMTVERNGRALVGSQSTSTEGAWSPSDAAEEREQTGAPMPKTTSGAGARLLPPRNQSPAEGIDKKGLISSQSEASMDLGEEDIGCHWGPPQRPLRGYSSSPRGCSACHGIFKDRSSEGKEGARQAAACSELNEARPGVSAPCTPEGISLRGHRRKGTTLLSLFKAGRRDCELSEPLTPDRAAGRMGGSNWSEPHWTVIALSSPVGLQFRGHEGRLEEEGDSPELSPQFPPPADGMLQSFTSCQTGLLHRSLLRRKSDRPDRQGASSTLPNGPSSCQASPRGMLRLLSPQRDFRESNPKCPYRSLTVSRNLTPPRAPTTGQRASVSRTNELPKGKTQRWDNSAPHTTSSSSLSKVALGSGTGSLPSTTTWPSPWEEPEDEDVSMAWFS